MGPPELSAVSTCSVTTATSPIGCQHVDKLLAAGHVVHAISRGMNRLCANPLTSSREQTLDCRYFIPLKCSERLVLGER
jgi:NADP-dependent 3-hydroxy acid dehydrogenase YdfG